MSMTAGSTSDTSSQSGPWASASVLDRVIACPASAALPVGTDVVGPTAAWGKEIHLLKEGKPTTPRVEKWFLNWDSELIAKLWRGGVHEPQYWVSPTEEVKLMEHVDFADRPKWPRESMFCSPDWVNLEFPWVDDLKTGMMPTSWTQLLMNTWAVGRHHHWGDSLASYTNWTRYPLGADPIRETKLYEREFVEDWYHDNVVPAKRLALGKDAREMTNPGPHCKWCRCKPYCPEWNEAT